MTGGDVREAMQRVTGALAGAEDRPGQLEMAEAVARAVETRRHLVVQAGTGTGKSLGYLVPTVLSGAKVVVATTTKALQDQLATKDLPFLAAHLGAPVKFSVLKGRSNYLCRQRSLEVAGGADQLELDPDGSVDAEDLGRLSGQVRRLLEWSLTTGSGDRSDLAFEPTPRAWAQVSVSATECPGAARCPAGDACFAEAARERAAGADVVVVNSHLYGMHLASGGRLLPEHDVVVFDEAHELEDVLASSLGLEIGGGRFTNLGRKIQGLVDDPGLAAGLLDAAGRWEDALAGWRGRRLPARPGSPEVTALADTLALVAERVAKAAAAARRSERDEGRRARALQVAGLLTGDLALVAAQLGGDGEERDRGRPGVGRVAWVEGPPHAPVFRMAPVDVGPLLAEQLWGTVAAVLTSATIPPHLGTRLGLPEGSWDEVDVGSPFPYAENGVLYCAAHLPDPRRPEYEAAMHAELETLITAAGGRTLALFTSWRAMQAAADALRPRLSWRLLTQSDLPKPALIAAFSGDEQSCLFATMGFWQGVDVPGPALSLVVIDRIPFPRPDEPLAQARRDRAGPAAFRLVDLSRAATLLAQGAGRLIRSRTDRGVVAVLDPRLANAGYRWDLVRALPPMRRTKVRAEVEAFLAPLREGAGPR